MKIRNLSHYIFPDPLAVSRKVYGVFISIAILGTILDCLLTDYSSRALPMWANILPIAAMAHSLVYTRLGKTNTNVSLAIVGISLNATFVFEIILLLFVKDTSYSTVWLMYNLFLMTMVTGLVGLVAGRGVGIASGVVVIVLGVLHGLLRHDPLIARYGPIWLFIVAWFIYLTANYRKRLDMATARHATYYRLLEEQSKALHARVEENRQALQNLREHQERLISEQRDEFHTGVLGQLTQDLAGPATVVQAHAKEMSLVLDRMLEFLDIHAGSIDRSAATGLRQQLMDYRSTLSLMDSEARLCQHRLVQLRLDMGAKGT